MDLNKCKHWKSNKNINPFTKRKIKIGGPVYKKIEKICTINDNDNDNDNEKKCNEWILNKNINPETKRKIKIGGPIYKFYENLCNQKKVLSLIVLYHILFLLLIMNYY